MVERLVNQFGEKPIYIDKNEGQIYIDNNYVEEPSFAFKNGSYELFCYTPTIQPSIRRPEVNQIIDWIERDASDDQSARIALLYGKAGIGKSVVMHDLLVALNSNPEYLVYGLKSDQVEFVDTNDLGRKIHLAQPIDVVIREMAQKHKRVVLLIDQIDALSLSLSSNRTPLRSLIKLIGQIKYIPHVRVVISCRPYDLEYDPLLDELRIKNKWELKEFTPNQVAQILKENNCQERLSDNLMLFLGNPLNLFLFLKVKPNEQLTDPLSTDLLYHQLWRKYVTDDSVRKINKDKLLALFDVLVSDMYKRQELSLHVRAYETEYDAELKYLFTNELLLITKNGHIQFFHQTLFDYVYARRFTEHGYDLLEELKSQHQGLFSRASVKSILTFLREQNPAKYIAVINQLLYAQDKDGTAIYRYHLKSLALSNMAYFEAPLKEEISLIARKIFDEKVYMDVLFESVHTANWFNAVWQIIDNRDGWKSLNTDYKEKVILMCQRTLWSDAAVVLDRIERSLDYNNEEDCKYIGNLIQYYDIRCDSKKLISFYNKLVKRRNPLEYTHLLRNILKEDPEFVCQELKENVRLQLQEKKTDSLHRIDLSHETEMLYQELLQKHHKRTIQLLIDLLTLIYESTKYEIEGSDINNSFEFFSFKRTSGGHFGTKFSEDAVNVILDGFIQNAESDTTKRYLSECSSSKHEGFVFIALFVYASCPDLYKDEFCELVVSRQVLSNAPAWVEYQAVEALNATFPLLSDAQKVNIINRILAIEDNGEKRLYPKELRVERVEFLHPILDIDIHKGKALEVIPIGELRRLSWEAYQERQRIDRKFHHRRLENDKPSSFSVHSGWSSLTVEQGIKMSCKTWYNSMLKYNTNSHYDWNKPSLTGQCNLFREVVSRNPDKYLELIDKIIQDDRILLAYPEAGMRGLIDAKRIAEADHVMQGILGVIGNDVNSENRGFSIHSFLFAINDMIKGDDMPESVFKLLCNTLINAKEPEEDIHKGEKDVYNVGINQARGNAGYMLVECTKNIQHKEEVFSTIEQIAETASVYTRAAILLNMAALNFLDQKRNVALFKKLLHDYDPRLMSMPVHNYNPLVYFINYAADDLIDFFNHAAECPECYREQVVILWLAWSHNNHDERFKALLDRMCNNSQEARISLLNFMSTLGNKADEDASVFVLRFFDARFDSPEMGEACDDLFHNFDSWSEDLQFKIADAFVSSPLSSHKTNTFIDYLAGFAIKEPVQTLKWLEQIIRNNIPDDYFVWNKVIDVIIQSYNGIKSFNDSAYQDTLEHALDMIDSAMLNPSRKYLVSNFINKLDNE